MNLDKLIMISCTIALAAILIVVGIMLSAKPIKVNCSFYIQNNNLYVQYDNDTEPLYNVNVTVQWYNGTIMSYFAGTSSGGNNGFVVMPFNDTETGLEFNITAVSAQTTP